VVSTRRVGSSWNSRQAVCYFVDLEEGELQGNTLRNRNLYQQNFYSVHIFQLFILVMFLYFQSIDQIGKKIGTFVQIIKKNNNNLVVFTSKIKLF
jgi:hypothetical protein